MTDPASTNLAVSIIEPGKDEDEVHESSCLLSWEIDNEEDNDGENSYKIGTSYTARLYKGPGILSVTAFSTNGTLSPSGSGTAIKSEQIAFRGSKTESLSHQFKGGFSYSLVGSAYDINGNKLTGINFYASGGVNVVSASVKCFAVIEATYSVSFDKYSFSASEPGTSVLTAISNSCGGSPRNASVSVNFEEEGSSSSCCCCSSCCCSTSSAINTTSVTLVYKDFVTGAVLEGVSVSMDGKSAGTTDASGKVTIQGVTVGVTHTLRATKDGYLNTDSDSLSNDSFVVN
jgi:hypothetical protein